MQGIQVTKKQRGQISGRDKNNTAFPLADLEQNTCDAPLVKEKIKRLDSPIRIHVHSLRKRLTDADGISAKAVIDGLVLAGILPDDSPKFIKEVTYSQEKAKEEKTIITLK